MALVGVDHGILREPAAGQRQEAGGEDLPGVADEHHALAVADPQRGPMKAAGAATRANVLVTLRVTLALTRSVRSTVRRPGLTYSSRSA